MKNREDSLAKTSKDLMLKEPYYGFFLIMLNKVWNNKVVPTAGVSKNIGDSNNLLNIGKALKLQI